jgi:hypothetical protein
MPFFVAMPLKETFSFAADMKVMNQRHTGCKLHFYLKMYPLSPEPPQNSRCKKLRRTIVWKLPEGFDKPNIWPVAYIGIKTIY